MREILFKAKRKSDGVWFEGMLTKTTVETSSETKVIYKIDEHNCGFSDESTFEPTYISGFSEEVDENTICQFTGLFDKHGNRIWENDIVKAPIYHDVGCYPYTETKIVVVKIPEIYRKSIDGNFEVIGNRFDNPELLAER